MGSWLRAAMLAQSRARVENATAASDVLKKRVDNELLISGAVAVGADLFTFTLASAAGDFQALVYLGGPNDGNFRAAATSSLLLCGASERGLEWVRSRIPSSAAAADRIGCPYVLLASELDAFARLGAHDATEAAEAAGGGVATMPECDTVDESDDEGEGDLGMSVAMLDALCTLLTPFGGDGLRKVFALHGERMDSFTLLRLWLEYGGWLRTSNEWKSFPTWASASLVPAKEVTSLVVNGLSTRVYLLPSRDFTSAGLEAAAAALIAAAGAPVPGMPVLFHGTDWGSMQSLVSGVDVRIPASERNYIGHDFGAGFYMSREIETAAFFSTFPSPLVAVFRDARSSIDASTYCELSDPSAWAAAIEERYLRGRLHRMLSDKHVVRAPCATMQRESEVAAIVCHFSPTQVTARPRWQQCTKRQQMRITLACLVSSLLSAIQGEGEHTPRLRSSAVDATPQVLRCRSINVAAAGSSSHGVDMGQRSSCRAESLAESRSLARC